MIRKYSQVLLLSIYIQMLIFEEVINNILKSNYVANSVIYVLFTLEKISKFVPLLLEHKKIVVD